MTFSVDAVDALLPQTQCRECGYDGCRPYAEAIVNNGEQINRCPPGGTITLHALSTLTHQPVLPLRDPTVSAAPKQVALIDESQCIGCTLCIKACPVDAIIGANKMMHTIIEDECTGCGLCLPPCPVDCITLVPHKTQTQTWALGDTAAIARADRARSRFIARNARIVKLEQAQLARTAVVQTTDLKAMLQMVLKK